MLEELILGVQQQADPAPVEQEAAGGAGRGSCARKANPATCADAGLKAGDRVGDQFYGPCTVAADPLVGMVELIPNQPLETVLVPVSWVSTIASSEQPAPVAPVEQQAVAAGDAITPAELEEAIRRLCQQHGAKWPRGWGADLARRAGVSKQAVSQRKAAVLAAMAGVA